MMKQILSAVAQDPEILPKNNPLKVYFESTPKPLLETYIRLLESTEFYPTFLPLTFQSSSSILRGR